MPDPCGPFRRGRGPSSPDGTPRRRRRPLDPAPLALVAALLTLACGATPYFLTVAPAGTLVIDVSVAGQWGDVASSSDVTLRVRITDQAHGFIAFRGGQSFVCDGVLGPAPRLDIGGLAVPRQPPGGAYRCVYTDERGRRTTLAVPVPTGNLAITAPKPGARVPAPYANPAEPTATGPVAPAPPTAPPTASAFPPPTATLIPNTTPLFITYTVPELPPGARGTASAEGDCYGGCFAVYGTDQPLTGTYALFGPGTSSTGGYTVSEPQAGRIVLSVSIAWNLAGSGFAAVHVTDVDHFEVPVTWIPAG